MRRGADLAADRDRRLLLLRLGQLVICKQGNPTATQTSTPARRVASELKAAGWRLERVLADNCNEFRGKRFQATIERLGAQRVAMHEIGSARLVGDRTAGLCSQTAKAGLEALHAATAGPAPSAMFAPALHRLASRAEAAEPAKDEPVDQQRDRNPDASPQHPASVAPSDDHFPAERSVHEPRDSHNGQGRSHGIATLYGVGELAQAERNGARQ
jgi:hypothetical protein